MFSFELFVCVVCDTFMHNSPLQELDSVHFLGGNVERIYFRLCAAQYAKVELIHLPCGLRTGLHKCCLCVWGL